jgi:ATP-dependent RNA helicase SUPV3L1/SUV3
MPPLIRSLPARQRARGVTAALGPTNTGKTWLAIERMTAYPTGMIGLPLRLLAREVYGRVVEKMGVDKVALITGEEKIKPKGARYHVCTVEAMPTDLEVDFVAIDEVQLCGDPDRGHVFTDRVLNRRGKAETLLVGAATMRPLIERLMPGADIIHRPRLSQLTHAGEKKITRLPRRSAIVAFSAEEVYAVAELIRRQSGGAAVVMGSLSPRTRNAQVEMFQSGEVDYLVATDAIGMGLNLDLTHVAFASDRKFDGHRNRRLTPAEFGQIAGRAGRHMRDGTFGTSGRCPAFEPELVEALQEHLFEPVKLLHWRNPLLDFAGIAALQASLGVSPNEEGLTRAQAADDELTLELLARDDGITAMARDRATTERLWEVCQLPDYRKLALHHHAELAGTIFRHLMQRGTIPADWFAAEVAALDRVDGDIDSLSSRIAQIRTWTFCANRNDWLVDHRHWQGVTRLVEDKLSDALHERLASRFVDRRTSVLMRRLRENAMLEAIVSATGDVLVEGQHVGTLQGFCFTADARAAGAEMKALNAAAAKALTSEIEARAARIVLGADEACVLSNDGLLRWSGEPVARLVAGEQVMSPQLRILADEHLNGGAREQVEARLALWLKSHLARHLGALQVLESPPDLAGTARGIAFQLAEALGVLERAKVAEEVKTLSQEDRAALRQLGVRFGAYHLYVPGLLKPGPRALAALLWSLKHGEPDTRGLTEIVHLAASGRTSIPVDAEVPQQLYRAAGFRVCGARALRVDILERLADLIRPAVMYRPGLTQGEPPAGTADGDGFVVTGAMTSLVGCSGADFASVLRSLNYAPQTRPGPAITVPLAVPAATVPVAPVTVEAPETAAHAVAAEVPAATENAAEAQVPANEDMTAGPSMPSETPAEAVAVPEPEQDAAPLADVVADVAEPAAAVPDPVAEPVAEIEVWRQSRAHHGDARRPQRHSRPNRADNAGVAATPGEAEQRPGRPARHDRSRYQARPVANVAPDGGTNGAAVAEGQQPADRGPRNWSKDRPPRNGGAGKTFGGKGGDARGNDGRRGDRNGPDGGKNRGKGGDRREWQQDALRAGSPPPRNERLPDPDSPFAKLLALKAELEARGKG